MLSRRSFIKGLAALPLVAAFLPKEVPTLDAPIMTATEVINRTNGRPPIDFDAPAGDYIYIGSNEPISSMGWSLSDNGPVKITVWDKNKREWVPTTNI